MTRVNSLVLLSVIVAAACNRPEPVPSVTQERHYTVCEKRTRATVYVEVDSSRRVLICVFARTPNEGPYRATPILNRIGDTLYVSARLELPDRGEATMLATVGLLPYEVMYGPLTAHSRLRITNRVNGQAPADVPALDTVIGIP